MTNQMPSPPPGYYPNPLGRMQWWDGQQWTEYAPPPAPPRKEVGFAYLFLLLLGGVGAHRFYLRQYGTAITLLVAFLMGAITAVILPPWSAACFLFLGIWVFVDLFRLPSLTREVNREVVRR